MVEDNIIIKAVLEDFESFMSPKSISDQYAQLTISKLSYFGIENLLKLLKTNIGIGTPLIGQYIILSGSLIRRLFCSIG